MNNIADLNYLENFPLELCVKIYEKLDFSDLMNLFHVSKRLEVLLLSDYYFSTLLIFVCLTA